MSTDQAGEVAGEMELARWVDASRRVVRGVLADQVAESEAVGAGDCEHVQQMRVCITRLTRLLDERPARPAREARTGHRPDLRLVG